MDGKKPKCIFCQISSGVEGTTSDDNNSLKISDFIQVSKQARSFSTATQTTPCFGTTNQVLLSQGFFLGVDPKTQGPKNSNSRNFSRKLKQIFRKNSRNRKMLRTFLPYITNMSCLCIRLHPKNGKI